MRDSGACVEAIKKDLGVLELSSKSESRKLHARIRQVLAVLPTGRLPKGLHIKGGDQSRYVGRILRGAQILMGESVLREVRNGADCISYYDFCKRLVGEEGFRECFTPLIDFLDELVDVPVMSNEAQEVDFRWARVIFLGHYLRELVQALDTTKMVSLSPTFKEDEAAFLKNNDALRNNQVFFEVTYPNPEV